MLNLMKEISGSSIFYKNTEGIILWHNNYATYDLMLNTDELIGKTFADIFFVESVKQFHEDDLEVMAAAKVVCKQRRVHLLNGEIREYFITKTPLMIEPGKVSGIIDNAINMKSTLCRHFKSCYDNNRSYDKALDVQLKSIYFNIKQPLKEILLLANLIMCGKINDDVKSLCLELGCIAKTLLSDCDNILAPKKVFIDRQKLITLHKINLKKLISVILKKQIQNVKFSNVKLFLTADDEIPEFVGGDLLRIKKILQSIIRWLLEITLECRNIKIKIHCNIGLLQKIDNQNMIISLIFRIENLLLQKSINDRQYLRKIFQLMSIFNMIKELEGRMELINNYASSKIIINLPFLIIKH